MLLVTPNPQMQLLMSLVGSRPALLLPKHTSYLYLGYLSVQCSVVSVMKMTAQTPSVKHGLRSHPPHRDIHEALVLLLQSHILSHGSHPVPELADRARPLCHILHQRQLRVTPDAFRSPTQCRSPSGALHRSPHSIMRQDPTSRSSFDGLLQKGRSSIETFITF